ncbi:hypothetical protein BH23BAC3_BH23BAC3_34620 [soil metagenome]
MKTIKAIGLVIVLMFAPLIANAQTTLEFENAESNLKLITNYVEALQNEDVGTMNEQFSESAMIYGLGGGMDSLDVTQHQEFYENSTSQYSHAISNTVYLPVKVTDSSGPEGEWILAWGVNTITHKQTGKKTEVPYQLTSLVEDGKIVLMRYYYDVLDILQNNGWTLASPVE